MLTALSIAPASRAGATYDSTILADSPVGYWPLDDASGTTARDLSVNGNNATYSSSGVTLSQTGIGDGETAALFDGTAGKVTLPNVSIIQPAHVSYEIWAKWNETPTTCDLWAGYAGGPLGIIPVGTGSLRFYYKPNLAYAFSTFPQDGAFHQIVGTYDETNVHVYIDGASAGTTAATGAITWAQLTIAGNGAGDGWFKGWCAKAALYSYALTPTQVSSHYNARASSAVGNAAGCAVSQAVGRSSVI